MHTQTHACMYTYMHVYIHACIRIPGYAGEETLHIHTHTYTYVNAHLTSWDGALTGTWWECNMHTYPTYIHTYMYTYGTACDGALTGTRWECNIHTYLLTYMHIYIHTCIHTELQATDPLVGHNGTVASVSFFHTKSDSLISASDDKTIIVWSYARVEAGQWSADSRDIPTVFWNFVCLPRTDTWPVWALTRQCVRGRLLRGYTGMYAHVDAHAHGSFICPTRKTKHRCLIQQLMHYLYTYTVAYTHSCIHTYMLVYIHTYRVLGNQRRW